MDHLCYLCLVFVVISRLFIAALWSSAGKGADLLALVCDVQLCFVTFPCGTCDIRRGHVVSRVR